MASLVNCFYVAVYVSGSSKGSSSMQQLTRLTQWIDLILTTKHRIVPYKITVNLAYCWRVQLVLVDCLTRCLLCLQLLLASYPAVQQSARHHCCSTTDAVLVFPSSPAHFPSFVCCILCCLSGLVFSLCRFAGFPYSW